MCLRQTDLARILAAALCHAHLTAVFKITVIRHVDRIRYLARNAVELVDLLADYRLGTHQPDRIWMRRILKDLPRGSLFHDTCLLYTSDAADEL